MTKPALSIVMATRNSARFVGEALASIDAALEHRTEYEVVIADAGSTDGTLDTVSRNDRVRVVSESDTGIYDGMNKAVRAARFPFLAILNSDDLLLEGGLARAVDLLAADPGLDMVSGGILMGTGPAAAVARRQDGPLSQQGALFGIPAINARIFRTETMNAVGPLRCDIGLAGDREFLLRWLDRPAGRAGIPHPVYFYRVHAGSQTIAGDRAGRARVYGAERQLATALLAGEGRGSSLARLARASHALASFKLGLSSAEADRDSRGRTDGVKTSYTDIARGLALALRWRGRLSGI